MAVLKERVASVKQEGQCGLFGEVAISVLAKRGVASCERWVQVAGKGEGSLAWEL